jgi:hypothetical protein
LAKAATGNYTQTLRGSGATKAEVRMFNRLMLAIWLLGATVGVAQAEDAGPAGSGEPGVVLELYTSQGCASCPPADALFATFADRSDVIALALHVDYWDYIGWRDRFAQPQFTARQKDYARRSGGRTIYTPQMIIGGTDKVQGFRPMAVQDLLVQHAARPSEVQLGLTLEDGRLSIRAHAEPPLGHEVSVQLVRYDPSEVIEIKAGENAGREVTYRNIVTAWSEVARWNGAGQADFTATVDGAQPIVVILQEAGHGPILAAQRLR